MKTTLLVVLYGKNYNQSKTLSCLADIKYNKYELIIFNNGPNILENDVEHCNILISLKNKGVNVLIQQDINNIPLSVIYNALFSNCQNTDRFILFDDDTFITSEYFEEIDHADNIDLIAPIILPETTGESFYPKINGNMVQGIYRLKQTDKIFSIGSGLVIYKLLVNKILSQYEQVFDERFAFYGVDFSLFRRVNMLRAKGVKINIEVRSSLIHSLSRVDKKDEVWREHERLWDEVLSLRYYEKNIFKLIFLMSKLIFRNAFPLRKDNLLIIYQGVSNGAHPRSVKYNNKFK